jgi:hypothetical protein
LPQVTDFDKVWTAEVAAMKTRPASPSIGQARSFAWLDGNERVENPVTGIITIIRPGDRETINIDASKRTYTISPGVSEIYSVTTGVPAGTSSATPPPTKAVLAQTFDTFPDATIDGVAYKGFAGRVTQTVSDSKCSYVQNLASVIAFVDPSRREPGTDGSNPYALWLTSAAMFLSEGSSCSVGLPDGALSSLPFYPDFELYVVSQQTYANRDISLQPLPKALPASVRMRGHVRTLTSADAALFEPPAGFTKVP